MFDVTPIAALQQLATSAWHQPQPAPQQAGSPFEALVLQQHRANFDLWHEEDAARNPEASDAEIARVKHAIDRLNQQRNDLVEQIDLTLLELTPVQNVAAPLHSETPGLIIDRLSILALKIFHTGEEAVRADASEAHRSRNRDRLAVLEAQREDLAACLGELWTQINSGQRRFKLYRQLKMYNDPTLNPVLYRARQLP